MAQSFFLRLVPFLLCQRDPNMASLLLGLVVSKGGDIGLAFIQNV